MHVHVRRMYTVALLPPSQRPEPSLPPHGGLIPATSRLRPPLLHNLLHRDFIWVLLPLLPQLTDDQLTDVCHVVYISESKYIALVTEVL